MNGHSLYSSFVPDDRIRRVAMPMADGRELIYFDDVDSKLPAERLADLRELPRRPERAQLRQDPLTGEWVSIATSRQDRVFLPPSHLDPLAPQTDLNPSEIPSEYDVVVFENKSPSFSIGPSDQGLHPGLFDQIGLERTLPSLGRCEVVCFSPDHAGSLGSQTANRVRTVIEAWAERTASLSLHTGIAQVFPFENRGEAIGVTLPHPHGQIYAYPFVTPRTERVIAAVEKYGPTLFADILDRESNGERCVIRSDYWTAFVPFAARWPIELHLLPNRSVPDLAATTLAEREDLAVILPKLLQAVDALYEDPTPYILAWHQAPVRAHREAVRLMMQITSPRRAVDKLKFLAGSEAAMGAWIGDVCPEDVAARLRDALQEQAQ